MVLTKSSCCGSSLRSGTLFYAYWVLVWSILLILCSTQIIYNPKEKGIWLYYFLGIGGVFGLIASILLLIGVYKNKSRLVFCFFFVSIPFAIVTIGSVFLPIMHAYFCYLIYSYYASEMQDDVL